jgi:hypothetical protein
MPRVTQMHVLLILLIFALFLPAILRGMFVLAFWLAVLGLAVHFYGY